MIYLISRVFLPWFFKIFWPAVIVSSYEELINRKLFFFSWNQFHEIFRENDFTKKTQYFFYCISMSYNIPEEVCESKVWLKVQLWMERGIHWLECVCTCLSMFEFRKEAYQPTKYTWCTQWTRCPPHNCGLSWSELPEQCNWEYHTGFFCVLHHNFL